MSQIKTQKTYPGLYTGIVEDTTDDKNLGRCRVRVPDIYGMKSETDTRLLPWALPCFPAHSFNVPQVGDSVWVMFQQGYADYPVWMGTYPRVPKNAVAKGRDPNSPAPTYRPPGNSPPPPEPLSIDDINEQRSVIAKILGMGDDEVPFPLGYNLDEKAVTTPGGSFQELLSKALSLFSKEAPNFETYYHEPKTEVPDVARTKQSPDPVVRVIHHSPTGHTFAYSDDPGNEFLRVIDRFGQELIFECPVKFEENTHNQSQRKDDQEARKDTQLPIKKAVDNTTKVGLYDALKQFLLLTAKVTINEDSGESEEASTIELRGRSEQYLLFDAKKDEEYVEICDKSGQYLLFDSKKDEECVALVSKDQDEILIDCKDGQKMIWIKTSDGHEITLDKDNNEITITHKGGNVIKLTNSQIIVADNAGTKKHLAFIEDVMQIFNSHTHGGVQSGGSQTAPPGAQFNSSNGTDITIAG